MFSSKRILQGGLSALIAALLLAGWWTRQHASPAIPVSGPVADATPSVAALPASDLQRLLEGLPNVTADADAPRSLGSPGVASRVSTVEDHAGGSVPAVGLPAVGSNYASFMARAEAGDTLAALQLGGALMVCGHLFQEMDRLHASLHPDVIRRDDAETAAAVDRVQSRLNSAFFGARMDNCKGIPQQDTESAGDWLERAARAGDALAAHLYIDFWLARLDQLATDPPRLMRFRANASGFMHRDAARCIPSAYLRLQQAYQLGTFETRDPMLAMAFGSVFAWLLGEASFDLETRAPNATPTQILQAQALANRLFDRYCR